MARLKKITFILLLISGVAWLLLWFTGNVVNRADIFIVLLFAAPVSSLITVCLLISCIGKRFFKKPSPYLIFGVTDGMIGICAAVYAVYDISTDTGWFAGLRGYLILTAALPVIGVLLLVDIIIWAFRKRKNPERHPVHANGAEMQKRPSPCPEKRRP